jgi:hypothetical protein
MYLRFWPLLHSGVSRLGQLEAPYYGNLAADILLFLRCYAAVFSRG